MSVEHRRFGFNGVSLTQAEGVALTNHRVSLTQEEGVALTNHLLLRKLG